MAIEDLRNKIDRVDENIVKLIAERIQLAQSIGEEKKSTGQPIEDLSREQAVLDKIKEVARALIMNESDVEHIFRQIFAAAKRKEGLTVGFQGETGAYSEEAAFQHFGSGTATKPYEKLDEVFNAVSRGEVQYGIIPIENSLEGSISQSYDLLLDSPLKVYGEVELRISHCLIGSSGATLDTVKKIYSHPQALGQSRTFLKHLNAELIPAYDTAGSVKMVKQMSSLEVAAVASERAAKIYGMHVLAKEIEDNTSNYTRFFILSKHDAAPIGKDKTSIVFSVKHEPGYLFDFLKILAEAKINMTKIESRPTRQKAWEYNFYLDFEGHRTQEPAKTSLGHLEQKAVFFKVLGSYPKAQGRYLQ